MGDLFAVRLKHSLPRSSLDALYQFAELAQAPEFKIGESRAQFFVHLSRARNLVGTYFGYVKLYKQGKSTLKI